MIERKSSGPGDIESSLPTSNEVIYESQDTVLFSQFVDGKFEKKWRHWTQQYIQVRRDKTLTYKPTKHSRASRVLDISTVTLTYIPLDQPSSKKEDGGAEANEQLLGSDIGLHVDCMEGKLPTAFKCVLPVFEVEALCSLLKNILDPDCHNVDEFIRELSANRGSFHLGDSSNSLPRVSLRNRGISTSNTSYYKLHHSRSVMRRSIAQAIDAHTYKTRIEKIISRRGAFKWLPVAFTNDLVHGSWWYVIGSFFGVIFPIFVIVGNHDSHVQQFRNDDDILFEFTYDTTWVLMIVSAMFFTLGMRSSRFPVHRSIVLLTSISIHRTFAVGSVAFLRAVNDPPMKPLIADSYHFGTDELLGSWCFVFATLPMIPYSLIYILATPNEWVVYFLMVVSVLSVAGAFLFLANCYPSDDDRPAYILPMIRALNCGGMCCSERLISKHLQNDWLAGTWIIMWLTVLATFATTFMFVRGIQSHVPIKIFIDGCTFLDCIMFLIGSVYFVAGSYPVDDDDDAGHSQRATLTGSSSAANTASDPHIDSVLNTLEQAVVRDRDRREDSEEGGESLCLLPGDSEAASSFRTEVTGYTVATRA